MKKLTREEKIANCVSSLTSKPDFPTFSEHIQKVLAAVDNSESTVRQLTDIILRDYSLTLKLLRTANLYNLSGRQIVSVSHAVIMLGTEGVRNLATSLMIFEHFCRKPSSVRELMMLSILSANHVRGIASSVPALRAEEAYLCGMVRNLGEVLIAYYLPGAYAQILLGMAQRRQNANAAALEILGFTFEDVAEAVIRYWGMPERVAACQQPLSALALAPDSSDALMHRAVSLGHNITAATYRMDPQAGAVLLKASLRDHALWLPLPPKALEMIMQAAISETQESFSILGIPLDHLSLDAQTHEALDALHSSTLETPFEAGEPETPGAARLERLAGEVMALLDAPDFELNDWIRKVLEAIYEGAGFDRVLFGFRSEDGRAIEGRIGVGKDVDQLVDSFQFRMSLSGGPVPLALLLRHTIASDTTQEEAGKIARLFGCRYLCLFPVVVARQVVGCFYGENLEPRPDLTERQIHVLEELRTALENAIARIKRRVALADTG